jgi:hypothetical protein
VIEQLEEVMAKLPLRQKRFDVGPLQMAFISNAGNGVPAKGQTRSPLPTIVEAAIVAVHNQSVFH